MTNPSPDKLSRLLQATQSRWKRPERRLVECGEIAVLRHLWIANRDEIVSLQNAYEAASNAAADLEERIPVVRDIAFWVRDPSAGVPFSLMAEALGVTGDDLACEMFAGVNGRLLDLVHNREPLRCPLCNVKK